MRTIERLAKDTKTFEQFIHKLQVFAAWYKKTEAQLRWGKAQWYDFYMHKKGGK